MQIGIFDGIQKFTINKPIRLIELFGGYGSQAFALKYLGANFEHWKLCEWAVKSIQAYKDAHCKDDNTDYSKDHSDEFILNRLTKWGISANYNEPMTKDQIKRLGVQKQRQIYNNIKATHNLVNIQQVHAEDLEIVDTDKYTYIMTYSFPCQDLSLAGKQAGMEKGSGTRSGMLWEVERILDECENLPQVLLMENVPEVIGTKNIKHFASWLAKLESLGYKCYWQVLNAKDYGVPQNRERCFMVSILGDYYYNFPQPFKLEHKLKDLLEDEVDEKYYLSDKAIQGIQNTNFDCNKLDHRTEKDGIMPTLCARDYKDPKLVVDTGIRYIGTYNYNASENFMQGKDRFKPNAETSNSVLTNHADGIVEQNLKRQLCNYLIESGQAKEGDVVRHSYTNNRFDRYYASNQENHDCSPTLDTRCDCLGVVVKTATKQGYEIANDGDSINLSFPNSTTRRGRVGKQISQTLLTNDQIGVVVNDIKPQVNTVKTKNKRLLQMLDKLNLTKTQAVDIYNQSVHDEMHTIKTNVDKANMTAVVNNYRIRKLTPKECFRLMGVRDKDFENIAQNQSNASLYHLAGDSIVVDVLMNIFKNML